MPETLARVAGILEHWRACGYKLVTLLVVPGRAWRDEQIEQLRQWEAAGYRLAAHGWRHEASSPRNAYHRLHSALISRDAAEHLSRSAKELRALLEQGAAWFSEQGLAVPNLYVPPAWAMGRFGATEWAQLPFRVYETQLGLREVASGCAYPLPLAGFEADTAGRAVFLAGFNRVNQALTSARRPLRIGLHPYDYDYRLCEKIDGFLAQGWEWLDYESALDRVKNRRLRPASIPAES